MAFRLVVCGILVEGIYDKFSTSSSFDHDDHHSGELVVFLMDIILRQGKCLSAYGHSNLGAIAIFSESSFPKCYVRKG